ncbi:MAG: DUF2336 domain-containing protein [Asticcacaulis sp.]
MAALSADTVLSMALASPAPQRGPLLQAMASLFEHLGTRHQNPKRAQVEEVFVTLALQAEDIVRAALAERLAAADWAPVELIRAFSLDDIRIAAPVLAQSPLLTEPDLVTVLKLASLEHQICVAQRPNLGTRVVETILDMGRVVVMTTLTSNPTARLSSLQLERLVEASRRHVALRAPLIQHPHLPPQLAERLYGWVGEALKDQIVSRFSLDPESLRKPLREALEATYTSNGPSQEDINREVLEQQLVDKLKQGGQLTPGYLALALRERKYSLFTIALSRLADVSLDTVRYACNGEEAETLAVLMHAVGVDKAAFATLLHSLRACNAGRPRVYRDQIQSALEIFRMPRATAQRRLLPAAGD